METAWFVSDVHIRDIRDPKYQILVQFIESLNTKRSATHLFLLGDIFDLWIGSGPFFSQRYANFVKAIDQALVRGVKVYYLEGNHDIQVTSFWRNRGVLCFQNEQVLEISKKKLFIAHGDFINPNEPGYHRYIRWVRSSKGRALSNLLPGQVWYRIGNFLSNQSRKKSSMNSVGNEEQIKKHFIKYCQLKWNQTQFDICVMGHIHIQIKEVLPVTNSAQIINLGTWLSEPRVLCLSSQGLTWENL